jgi:hypothetical protein
VEQNPVRSELPLQIHQGDGGAVAAGAQTELD